MSGTLAAPMGREKRKRKRRETSTGGPDGLRSANFTLSNDFQDAKGNREPSD